MKNDAAFDDSAQSLLECVLAGRWVSTEELAELRALVDDLEERAT